MAEIGLINTDATHVKILTAKEGVSFSWHKRVANNHRTWSSKHSFDLKHQIYRGFFKLNSLVRLNCTVTRLSKQLEGLCKRKEIRIVNVYARHNIVSEDILKYTCMYMNSF